MRGQGGETGREGEGERKGASRTTDECTSQKKDLKSLIKVSIIMWWSVLILWCQTNQLLNCSKSETSAEREKERLVKSLFSNSVFSLISSYSLLPTMIHWPFNNLNVFNLSSRAAGLHLIGQIYWHAERECVAHGTPFITAFAASCDTSCAR